MALAVVALVEHVGVGRVVGNDDVEQAVVVEIARAHEVRGERVDDVVCGRAAASAASTPARERFPLDRYFQEVVAEEGFAFVDFLDDVAAPCFVGVCGQVG